jgi:hypothetical protein
MSEEEITNISRKRKILGPKKYESGCQNLWFRLGVWNSVRIHDPNSIPLLGLP